MAIRIGRVRYVLAALAGLLVVACGGAASTASTPTPAATHSAAPSAAPVVGTRTATVDGKSETIFVDAKGLTLYYYTPDKGGTVTCTGKCLAAWPPVVLPSGVSKPSGPSMAGDKLGTVSGPSGTQVTFNGWPLYTYAEDTKPGDVTGQNVGGKWFVVTPDTPPAK
jgi:predicted lipoprotein with Yx(FWY)xxD motif